ncbi:MAG: sugar ABC transporter permease [Treponema sp.]|jgi:multiple sugar transport system permease protein|nr:sugar ABC transporter permease [Treponema sp.]
MKQKIGGNESRLQRWGYFFVLPFVATFCFFNLWPMINTFLLAFSDLKGLRSDYSIVGLANFSRLVKDKYFWEAVGNTFVIWGWNFLPQIGLALILSIWFSDMRLKLRGKNLVRAIIYMPNLLTAVSVAMLFRSMFYYPTGPINQFLTRNLGLYSTVIKDGQAAHEAFNFFRSVPTTRGVVAFIQFWMWYGQTVILLMAGITSIPSSLYESAVVDGANSRQTTLHITLPLLRPMMLYILVTSVIGGMQMYDIPFLLTDGRGAPDFKIRTTNMYFYNVAFQGVNDYSFAAAISVGIFIITIIISMVIFFMLQDRNDLKKEKAA